MSKPLPPCDKDCLKRRPGCQTAENCEKWGPYQTALAEWHAARRRFWHGYADMNAVRTRQLHTPRARNEMNRKKQGR